MEFYSPINKNEIVLFEGNWMELENFMLSEVSQAQKIKDCLFSLIGGNQTCKLNVYIETYISYTR
jgi:hypothetical protein